MDVTVSNTDTVRAASNAGQTSLRIAASLWFVVAVVGQLLFAVSIVALYMGYAISRAARGMWLPHII